MHQVFYHDEVNIQMRTLKQLFKTTTSDWQSPNANPDSLAPESMLLMTTL